MNWEVRAALAMHRAAHQKCTDPKISMFHWTATQLFLVDDCHVNSAAFEWVPSSHLEAAIQLVGYQLEQMYKLENTYVVESKFKLRLQKRIETLRLCVSDLHAKKKKAAKNTPSVLF